MSPGANWTPFVFFLSVLLLTQYVFYLYSYDRILVKPTEKGFSGWYSGFQSNACLLDYSRQPFMPSGVKCEAWRIYVHMHAHTSVYVCNNSSMLHQFVNHAFLLFKNCNMWCTLVQPNRLGYQYMSVFNGHVQQSGNDALGLSNPISGGTGMLHRNHHI